LLDVVLCCWVCSSSRLFGLLDTGDEADNDSLKQWELTPSITVAHRRRERPGDLPRKPQIWH